VSSQYTFDVFAYAIYPHLSLGNWIKTPDLIYTNVIPMSKGDFRMVRNLFIKHISPHTEKLTVLFLFMCSILLGSFLTRSWPFRNDVKIVIGSGSGTDAPTQLAQYKSDGSTNISTGGTTDETTVVLSMSMTDPDNPASVRPQIEIRAIGTDFTGSPTDQGGVVSYTGTPLTGSVTVSSLSSGTSYHWQARVCDSASTCSSWVTFGGNSESESDFQVVGGNSIPNTPSSLGPADKVSGQTTTNTTPTLEFSLSDPDTADQLRYWIQIDDSSDFSSLLVSYRSATQAQGSRNFIVGQSVSGGTYVVGSQGQTLVNGSYYWRVKAVDASGAESGFVTANSGAVAFIVDTSGGSGTLAFSLTSPVDNSYVNDERPDFAWSPTSDDGSGTSQYKMSVANTSAQDDFSIDSIAPAGSSSVVTGRYTVSYQGFYDGSTGNNNISVVTSSSSEWPTTQNDGKIKEGKRTWTINGKKSDGTSLSHSSTVNVDLTKPTVTVSKLTYSTSSVTVEGNVTDTKNGSLADQSDYIRSDPKQAVISITQGTSIISQSTIDLQQTCNYSDTTSTSLICSFSQTFNQTFDPSTYTFSVTGTDKAGNQSTYQQTLAIINASPTTQTQASPATGTPSPSPILEPTLITNIKISSIGLTTAQITWNTNHPATSKVNYGLSPEFEHSVYDGTLVIEHKMQLKDLLPDTNIYFEVISQGNTTVYDAFRIFRTKKELSELTPIQAVSEVQTQLQSNPTIKQAAETTSTVVGVGAGTAALGSFIQLIFGTGGLTSVGLSQGIANLVSSLLLSLGIIKRQRKKTHGVVFNALTGDGIPGAYLIFHSKSGNLRSTITNRDGRYTVTLVPDLYTVKIIKEGFRIAPEPNKSAYAYGYANLFNPTQGITVANEPFTNMAIAVEPTVIANTLRRYWRTIQTNITGLVYKNFYVFIFIGLLLSGFATFIKPSIINGISFSLLFMGLFIQVLASFNKTRNYGVVVNARGKPSPYLSLDLYRWNGRAWDIYTHQTTDAQGRYILTPEDGYYFMRLLSSAKQILAQKQFMVNNVFPAIREKFVIPL